MERTQAGRTDDPLIGRVLDGRYEVGPRIARGGMATVYQATDLRLDRTVAVKVMHAGMGDDLDFVSRFQREARSAARLAHHNVVAVFDQGDDNGTLFLVMEYVPGPTLRDVIRKEAPMDPGKALAVLEPVLAALAAAHSSGMIHRDVKPENVLLGTDADSGVGRVKVADFGLARAVNAETQHTATGGVLIGTVSYLSPELVVDGKADARADVYAAGVILYEMLTGQKPHQADSPIQVAYKHVHEDVPPPSARVPGLPAYVDALVARATARDQDLRPSDARVLLHQVRRVRQALDHGVVDDPELTADLLPRSPVEPAEAPVADEPEVVPTGELFEPGVVVARSNADDVYDQDSEVTTPVAAVPVAARVPVSTEPSQHAPAYRPPAGPVQPAAISTARPRSRRSRRGPIMLVALLLAALLVGLGGWYLGVARYTHTPAVINLSAAAAKAKVEKAGLHFREGKAAYSETVARGAVISTDPAAGDRISKDGTVTAVISLGPERYDVPNARGKSLDEAQSMIDAAHLAFGRAIERYNETVPAGQVVNLDPAPGTPVKRDTAIDVIVSKGPKPIAIPDLTGKPAADARKQLEDLGFEVDTTDAFSDTVPAGKVISQTPDSGTGKKGDTISLSVSKGPQMVTIPRVFGLSTSEATRVLQAAGFKVKVERSHYVGFNTAYSTSPGQGSKAPKGSTVVLSIV